MQRREKRRITKVKDLFLYSFRFKAWANDELLSRLSGIGADAPVTQLAIKALSHSYVVDRIFAAHLRRQSHPFTSANLVELPNLQDLAAATRASDLEYVEYVATLDDEQLLVRLDFEFTDGALGRMSREEMLMHVITHGVGHRGQVSAVMLMNGLAPAKDGLTTYLHGFEPLVRRRKAA
jgi:uncharacterized damage-inducible protein DinB